MTAPLPFVFVLMPFEPSFDDVYELGIKPACERAGADAARVSEQLFQESILEHVYEQIRGADLVVADMSDRNPNVFYETGYAHALAKPVILMTRNVNDIPFDLKHYPHIIYDGKITRLLPQLEKRVRRILKTNPRAPRSRPAGTVRVVDGGVQASGLPLGGRQALHPTYPTIEEAVAASQPGDRIVIRPGVYYERIVIAWPLHIEGDTRGGEIVVQEVAQEEWSAIVHSAAPFASVRNLRICNLGRKNLPAVSIHGGRLLLENCDVTSHGGHCIAVHGGEPVIRRNRIHHGGHGGIAVFGGARPVIVENEIFENYLSGIFITDGAMPVIRKNVLRDGKQSGIYAYDRAGGIIEENEIVRNAHAGIASATGANPYVRANVIRHCGHYGAVYVFDNGGGFFENNDLEDNRHGAWQVDGASEKNVTRTGNEPGDF